MMKKKMKDMRIVGLVVLMVFFMVASALAFNPFGAKKDEGKKVDVDGLSKRSATLVNNVQTATISFAEGIVFVQEAVGQEAAAEQLKQSIANAKEKKGDQNATKALVSSVNKAAGSLNQIDFAAKMNKEKAKESLGNSILKIGAGVILDGIAAKNASDLLQESQAALKQVSFTSAGKVKDVIDVAKFVAQEIPPQASSMQQFSAKLIEYAKTNGIPTPSPEAIKKETDSMQEN
ncbi:MAG TPA: hypothetical protein PKJ25_10545 [Smithellaceae bacterium]|nr:hypothetical protein [Smithellaceae bacterium]